MAEENFDAGDVEQAHTEIAQEVLKGIDEEGFEGSAVETLLHLVKSDNQIDMLGDVLVYLAKHNHPDWAAEICRMVMVAPKGQPPDYSVASAAIAYMVDMQQLEAAHKVATFILMLKDNGQGGVFFDCYDISFVLGNMVGSRRAQQAGAILYAIYCDDSQQGQMYQELIPYVLGTLVDYQQPGWALELSKQLMYVDGDKEIDYSCMGWAMSQMVCNGRSDWAACICDGLKGQQLPWYDHARMLDAISQWGGPSASQTVANFMITRDSPNRPPGGGPKPAGSSPSKQAGTTNGASTVLHANAPAFSPKPRT